MARAWAERETRRVLAGLGALGRDAPPVAANLRPLGVGGLAGPRRAQHRQRQRLGGYALGRGEVRHEHRHVEPWQRRVMLNLLHLAGLRQLQCEVTYPSSRVLALAQAVDLGRVQYRRDPAAQAAGRLGLGQPDRPQHRQHMLGADLADRELVQRLGVVVDGLGPLLVLPVLLDEDLAASRKVTAAVAAFFSAARSIMRRASFSTTGSRPALTSRAASAALTRACSTVTAAGP